MSAPDDGFELDDAPLLDEMDTGASETYPLATPSSVIRWDQRCRDSRRRFLEMRRKCRELSEDEAVAALTHEILMTERAAESMFLRLVPDNEAVLVEGYRRRAFQVQDKSEDLLSYLLYRYRLNARDPITRAIVANLRSVCLERGWLREPRRYAAYDRERGALFISRYNGWAWQLDGEGVDVVSNGRYVYFADDDGGRVWGGARRAPLVANHGKLLSVIGSLHCAPETPGGMTPDDQRRAFIAWAFATAFHDLLPAKPFLLVEGAPGSGKTAAVSLLQRVIHGRDRVLQVTEGREDDFAVQLVRSPIAMFDNVDSYVKWLPNAICTYVTKGEWVRRRLYTDDRELVIRPHAFPAATSMNPSSFRRGDMVDRIVVLRLARRPEFVPLSVLQARIEADIEDLYGEWLYWLGRIVARLRTRGGALNASGRYRMADFAAFAIVVGEALGWTDAETDAMLSGLQRERDAFASETDDVVDLVDRWVMIPANPGRAVDADELLRSLNVIADAISVPTIKGVGQLIQRLRSPHLQARYEIQTTGRDGAWVYTIRRRPVVTN